MSFRKRIVGIALGFALIAPTVELASAGDVFQLGEHPQLAEICLSAARETGLRFRLNPEAGSESDVSGACLDPRGTPWIMQLTDSDKSFLRFNLEALGVLFSPDDQGETTLEHVLALDEVEWVTVEDGVDQKVGFAPGSDASCTPLEEARRRLTATVSAFGLRSESEGKVGAETDAFVCLPPDSGLVLLVGGNGRIGRIGLAPEALARISARILDEPGALLGAFADELPQDLKQLQQDGLQLTLTYRGGRSLKLVLRAHNLDYYLE